MTSHMLQSNKNKSYRAHFDRLVSINGKYIFNIEQEDATETNVQNTRRHDQPENSRTTRG